MKNVTEKFQCQTEIFQSEKMVKYGKTEIFQCDTEKFQSEIFAFGERVNAFGRFDLPKGKSQI